jgi:hypothetical protein
VTGLAIAALLVGAAAALAAAGSLLYLAFFLPFTVRSMRLLPRETRTTVDGVATIEDAVAACRASGLEGIELVAFAQRLAARKMRYSRRNPWDSWERCFERGQGYCIQKGMSLKLILDRLGIESVPVQSARCAFPPDIVHGRREPARISGHLWLRVRLEGSVYDVCPGSFSNRPGVVHFKVLSPARRVPGWLLPILHVFSAAENVRRDWKNLFPRS